eukprot:5201149-Amphidinium_carterae.1
MCVEWLYQGPGMGQTQDQRIICGGLRAPEQLSGKWPFWTLRKFNSRLVACCAFCTGRHQKGVTKFPFQEWQRLQDCIAPGCRQPYHYEMSKCHKGDDACLH